MSPIDAHDALVKSGGMSQILLWTSFAEIFGGIALFQTIQGKRAPGDFKFDPLGLSQVPCLCCVIMPVLPMTASTFIDFVVNVRSTSVHNGEAHREHEPSAHRKQPHIRLCGFALALR